MIVRSDICRRQDDLKAACVLCICSERVCLCLCVCAFIFYLEVGKKKQRSISKGKANIKKKRRIGKKTREHLSSVFVNSLFLFSSSFL